MIEVSTGIYDFSWRMVETLTVVPTGSASRHDTTLNLTPRRAAKTSGRSLELPDDDLDPGTMDNSDLESIRVRVRFCLEANMDTCGDYTEAESKIISSLIFFFFFF